MEILHRNVAFFCFIQFLLNSFEKKVDLKMQNIDNHTINDSIIFYRVHILKYLQATFAIGSWLKQNNLNKVNRLHRTIVQDIVNNYCIEIINLVIFLQKQHQFNNTVRPLCSNTRCSNTFLFPSGCYLKRSACKCIINLVRRSNTLEFAIKTWRNWTKTRFCVVLLNLAPNHV